MRQSSTSHWQDYMKFNVDLLNATLKGEHRETWILGQLFELFNKKNPYARQALEKAKEKFSPKSNIANSFWKKAENGEFKKDVGGGADRRYRSTMVCNIHHQVRKKK